MDTNQGNNLEPKKRKFDIEKIPKERRKALLLAAILIIMLVMFAGWIASIQKLFRSDEKRFEKSEWQEISDNFNSILDETKNGVDYAKNKLEAIINPKEISEAEVARIKEKIILKETADWQTYKDENYKFEFKYPNYLNIVSGDSLATIVSQTDGQEPKKIIEIKNYDFLLDVENNVEIKKYLPQADYFLAAIDLEKSTTSDLIIETFKLFQ